MCGRHWTLFHQAPEAHFLRLAVPNSLYYTHIDNFCGVEWILGMPRFSFVHVTVLLELWINLREMEKYDSRNALEEIDET